MSEVRASPPPPQLVVAQTSTLAIVSLVAGIVSWFMAPFLGAIIAVITGHMAKNEIRRSMGLIAGNGMATAGLVLGYLQLGLTIAGLCVAAVLLALGISPLLCIPFANQMNF